MITAAMIAYYVVAIGLLWLVAYLTARSGIRRSRELNDRLIAEMQEKYGHTPPLEPYVREPLPELPPPPELLITISKHPEADGDRLPRLAAEVIRQVSRLESSFGGDGLDYDAKGSIDEPTRLVLRLVPRSADWEATDRLEAVAKKLNVLAEQARQGEVARQDGDIRARIDRELHLHLSPAIASSVAARVATGANEVTAVS
ncbi:MAG: hypothetical protein K2V38_10600 [Gemmataceae bacterium]|nr:hypothetical protein [Gemmataceae bacterium]